MNILSIDTTAEICSIALKTGSSDFVFHESRPREHAKILLPEIDKLITLAGIHAQDIDLIVFGRGPGSFTGIRIATSVAQGLALSVGCQLIPVSTLQSLAWSSAKEGNQDIWVALDARMSEIYFARYKVSDQGIPEPVVPEQVLPPALVTEIPTSASSFIGSGWLTDYPRADSLAGQNFSSDLIQGLPKALHSTELALALLKAGKVEAVDPENAQPVYLRDKVTWDAKPKVGS